MSDAHDRMEQLRQARSAASEVDRVRTHDIHTALAHRTAERLRDLRDILTIEAIRPTPYYTETVVYGNRLVFGGPGRTKPFGRKRPWRNLYTYTEAGSGWWLPRAEFIVPTIGSLGGWSKMSDDPPGPSPSMTTLAEVWRGKVTARDYRDVVHNQANHRDEVEGLTRGPGSAGAVTTDVIGIVDRTSRDFAYIPIGDLDEKYLTGWYLDVVEELRLYPR